MKLRHRFLSLTLFIVSVCSPLVAQQPEAEQGIVVIRWSPSIAIPWINAGRTGPFEALTPTIGTHTSESYIHPSILAGVRKRYEEQQSGNVVQLPVLPIERIAVIRYSAPLNPWIVARKLSTIPGVEYAEPLVRREIIGVPNDPLVSSQYHLPLIKAFEAWDLLPATGTVVVGIVDTGVDTTHPDLRGQIWKNTGETGRDTEGRDKRSNGIDDDGNGFVDDHFGWDFVGANGSAGDNSPLPGNSHGTHVGGIVGAIIDNNDGVAGTAKNVVLMPVKISNDDPFSRGVSRGGDGILYAAINRAAVINCSWGSTAMSLAEVDVIDEATSLGSLIVGAAGNNGENTAFYPAAYSPVLSVAATNESDRLTAFSNINSTVDVSAPGQGIVSTVPVNRYEAYDGTSMAAPIASAIAAMVRLLEPNLTPRQVLARIRATSDAVDTSNPFTVGLMGTGRVNALRAITSRSAKHAMVVATEFTDGGDDIFSASEEISINPTIRNLLVPLTNAEVTVTVVPGTFSVDILTPTVRLGAVATEADATPSEPIRVRLPSDVPFNGELALLLTIKDGNDVVGRDLVTSTVNPTYRTITENDLSVTVNSSGNLGYNDYPENAQGVGIKYRNSASLTYEGALIIANSPDRMSNVARSANPSRKDTSFSPVSVVRVATDSIPSGIRAVTEFDDRYEPFGMGVRVRQSVLQMTDEDVRKTVLIVYDITNVSDTTMSNVHVAQYHDWDIGPAGADNGCAWDHRTGIGLVQNVRRPEFPVVGVSFLSDLQPHFFALDNDGDLTSPDVYENFFRIEKWSTMSSGIARSNSRVTDVSMMIGGGPFDLAPRETRQVVFAIGAAANYTELSTALANARQRAIELGLNATTYTPTASRSRILFLANGPVLQPGSASMHYTLRQPGAVVIDLLDIFGRQTAVLLNKRDAVSGDAELAFDVPNVASGTYFIRLQTATDKDYLPIVIRQ